MKRRTAKKHARSRYLQRSNDRHDRWYLLAFVRDCIDLLSRQDLGGDEKVHTVAALARRLAPAIKAARTRTA